VHREWMTRRPKLQTADAHRVRAKAAQACSRHLPGFRRRNVREAKLATEAGGRLPPPNTSANLSPGYTSTPTGPISRNPGGTGRHKPRRVSMRRLARGFSGDDGDKTRKAQRTSVENRERYIRPASSQGGPNSDRLREVPPERAVGAADARSWPRWTNRPARRRNA